MHTLLPLDLKSRVFCSGVGFPIQLKGQFQGVFVFVLGCIHPKPQYT